MIYVIQNLHTGHIKIGRSGRVDRRLLSFLGYDIDLKVLALLDERFRPHDVTEGKLHERFDYCRIHPHEWFEPDEDLLKWIDSLPDSSKPRDLTDALHRIKGRRDWKKRQGKANEEICLDFAFLN